MTDRLFVKNLTVFAYHGVDECENKLGQRYEIDLTCETDFTVFTEEDNYDKAVCYAALADTAAKIAYDGPFNLIETLGDRIATKILADFHAVSEVTIQIRKPSAPIAHVIDYAAIELTRSR